MEVINSHCSHDRALDTGGSVTGAVVSCILMQKYVNSQAANELNSFVTTVKPQHLYVWHLWDSQVCGNLKCVMWPCLLIWLYILLYMFCFVVCLCLSYIYLAYVWYSMFSSGFNIIVIKCVVSSIMDFSYHHHHISSVLVWLQLC